MTPKRPHVPILLSGSLAALMLALPARAVTVAPHTVPAQQAEQLTIPTLDTHSLGLFRVSLDKMLVSLTPQEREHLHDALRRLADEALFNGEAPGGKPLSFKTPTVQVLYDSMADRLNGLTYGEILRLKG